MKVSFHSIKSKTNGGGQHIRLRVKQGFQRKEDVGQMLPQNRETDKSVVISFINQWKCCFFSFVNIYIEIRTFEERPSQRISPYLYFCNIYTSLYYFRHLSLAEMC